MEISGKFTIYGSIDLNSGTNLYTGTFNRQQGGHGNSLSSGNTFGWDYISFNASRNWTGHTTEVGSNVKHSHNL